jgi:hypothetical protein
MLKRALSSVRRKIFEAEPAVCMDLVAWAQGKKIPVVPLAEPLLPHFENLFRDFPLGQEMIAFHRETLSRRQALVAIKGTSIRDRAGIVELPDAKIVFEGNWWLPTLKEDPAYKRRFGVRSRKMPGNLYSLLSRWSCGYYHWFHDVLPRLEACISYLPKDCLFLVEESPPRWQVDSLAAYGINTDQLVEQSDGCNLKVGVLWVATPAGQTGLGSIELIKKVANRLKKHFGIQEMKSERKIYLSRQKSQRRRLQNDGEVVKILGDLGFEKIFAEECTLQQQIEIFSQACMVVSAHGAGLTNMIFSPAGCVVGEINFEDSVFRAHYRVLAMQMGFLRFFLPAAKTNEMAGEEYDLTVDFEELRKILNLLP